MLSTDKTRPGLFAQTQRWLECKNVGEEDLDGYSAAEVVGAIEINDRIVLEIQRPTDFAWRPRMVVTGPTKIEAGDKGACLDSDYVLVKYDRSGTVPSKGETWGPVEGSGEVRQHVPGGRVLRDGTDGTVLIQRYQPQFVWGKTTQSLAAGRTGTIDFYRHDPAAGSGGTLVAVSGVQLHVTEASGETDSIDEDTFVFSAWDDQARKYILAGWVC